MKRKLLFLIPIISLLLLLSSCSLFNFGQKTSSSSQTASTSQSTSKSITAPSSSSSSEDKSSSINSSKSSSNRSSSKPASSSASVPRSSSNTPSISSTPGSTPSSEASSSVSQEAYVTSIVLEEDNPSIYIETLDDDLEDIKMRVIYSDNNRDSINLSKDLMSISDYNSLKNPGDNTITINYSGVRKNITIKSQHMVKWEVNFLNYDNDILKSEEIINGEAAMAPKNPSDYFDEGTNQIFTFDKWDQDFSVITKNTDIKAVFKVKEKVGVDYLAVINSETSADITIETKNSTSIYNLRVMDENSHLIQAISNPTSKLELTNLNSNTTYKITGTYMFYFNGKLQELDVVESSFKTGIFTQIESINDNYVVDPDIISYDSIYVDLTSYIENAPDGYKLMGVALYDSNDELIEEKTYDGNNLVFFENLTPETTYTTYFFYDKVTTEKLTGWTDAGYEANGNVYRYYFRGFQIQTSAADETMKCVRIVYNDPVDGEVLLYRYYVSEGSDVQYGNIEYSNPFSFRMPIKYEKYIAIGDYRELTNITDDKTVSVLLFPISKDVDTGEHLVVFVQGNTSYIISYEYVQDGSPVTPPEYEYTIPQDSNGKHYEKVWKQLRGDSTIDNITSSTIFYPSYEMHEVLAEPTFTLYDYYTQVGTDFFYTRKGYDTKLALIENGEKISLVKTSDNSEVQNSYDKDDKNYLYYNNLEPNTEYKFTCEYKYDIHDSSGVKTKTYEFTFTTSPSTLDYFPNLKITSPNYHQLDFDKGTNSTGDGIIAKTNPDYYEYSYTTFGKTSSTTSLEYLNTNTKYYIYTYKQDEGEFKYKRLSGVCREFSTLDSVEPLIFRLQIHVKKDSKGNFTYYSGTDPVRLYIDNFDTQKDIGRLDGYYYIHSPMTDFDHYGMNQGLLSFEFDKSKGYYSLVFYNFYSDLLEGKRTYTDPETGQNYEYYASVGNIDIVYQYNGTKQAFDTNGHVPSSKSDYDYYLEHFTPYENMAYIKFEIIYH